MHNPSSPPPPRIWQASFNFTSAGYLKDEPLKQLLLSMPPSKYLAALAFIKGDLLRDEAGTPERLPRRRQSAEEAEGAGGGGGGARAKRRRAGAGEGAGGEGAAGEGGRCCRRRRAGRSLRGKVSAGLWLWRAGRILDCCADTSLGVGTHQSISLPAVPQCAYVYTSLHQLVALHSRACLCRHGAWRAACCASCSAPPT